MSLAVRTRNAMPKYGPEWMSKNNKIAGAAGAKARWKNHKKVDKKAKKSL